jgi:hypothetical protein
LVFCAYTFILCHQWTGGLRPRWAKKPLNTFTEALEGLRTAISFLFTDWFNWNPDVFPSYQASLGCIWPGFLFQFRYLNMFFLNMFFAVILLFAISSLRLCTSA